MPRTITRVPFEEFVSNLGEFFDRVAAGNETLVVDKGGVEIEVSKPEPAAWRAGRKVSAADREAFLATAGGWKGLVDGDGLVDDIYRSRSMPPRPPVRFDDEE